MSHTDLRSGIDPAKRSRYPEDIAWGRSNDATPTATLRTPPIRPTCCWVWRREGERADGQTKTFFSRSAAEHEPNRQQGFPVDIERPEEGRGGVAAQESAWGPLVLESSGEKCDSLLLYGKHYCRCLFSTAGSVHVIGHESG